MKKKLLIVDDEPDIREFLAYFFRKHDFEVELATDGADSCSKAECFLPHLVLMDLMMPGMTGYEAAKKIRENPAFDDTRIIIFSALPEAMARATEYRIFFDDFIPKTATPGVILEKLRQHIC